MTGLTDPLAGMYGRPALTPCEVGFGLSLAHRRLNFTRCRPQERVRTRPSRLGLTHIEFVVHHKAGQPGGENIALDWPHTTVAHMPAERQRLFCDPPTQAYLTETRGLGRKLVYFRASICSFATEECDEGSRPAKPYRFAEHLLKSPVGEAFEFDDVALRQYPVDLAAVQTLPMGSLLPLQFGQPLAGINVAFREAPFFLALLDRAVFVVVVGIARPALAVELPLQFAKLFLLRLQFIAEMFQAGRLIRHHCESGWANIYPRYSLTERVLFLLVGLAFANELRIKTNSVIEFPAHDPHKLDLARQAIGDHLIVRVDDSGQFQASGEEPNLIKE